jgi:ABC-type arginine transport system permease subunit
MIVAVTNRPLYFCIMAALRYLVLTTILAQLLAWFERKYRLIYGTG